MAQLELDPYKNWLGISDQKRPLTHYTLLGIADFESRREVINRAANGKVATVRSFIDGPHGSLAKKLLLQIETARLCLTSEAAKLRYDQGLRIELKSPPIPPPVAVAIPRAIPVTSVPASHAVPIAGPIPLSAPAPSLAGDLDLNRLETLLAHDRLTQSVRRTPAFSFDLLGAVEKYRGLLFMVVLVALSAGATFEGGRFASRVIAEYWAGPADVEAPTALVCTSCHKALSQADATWHVHPRFPDYGTQPFHSPCFELLKLREGRGSVASIDRRSFSYMGAFSCGCFAAIAIGVYYFSRF